MHTNIRVSVVVPVYNEEEVIESFLQTTLAVMTAYFIDYEIILIDDGSTDSTVKLCSKYLKKYKSMRLISFSRNYGHEIASTAGLEHASGDYVVLMDADLQHPPELIPDMVEKATTGYDVVCALRSNRDDESWMKKTMARLFYSISRRMTGFELDADTGNFRLLSRKVVDSLNKMKESNRHLIMMFAYVGFKTTNISYHCPERIAGKTKYNIVKLISLSLDSIIGFSSRPLRLMSIFSVMISIIMMCYAGFILIQKLFTHQQLADGMASVIFLISGLFSVLFLFLAVISEYISRILIESKNRPLYNVESDLKHEPIEQDIE
ncbi:MAG: glycosyltransferase family 2 protein [Legionellaceae bacterium]|nr:glycosyltransferase family 2 protein [Legionellaceae bacterium]